MHAYKTPRCIHTYMHTCQHKYMNTYIHTCMHTFIHTYINASITYIHTLHYITYIHTYMHAHIYAYIHTYGRFHKAQCLCSCRYAWPGAPRRTAPPGVLARGLPQQGGRATPQGTAQVHRRPQAMPKLCHSYATGRR